jgi:hypothetical protein
MTAPIANNRISVKDIALPANEAPAVRHGRGLVERSRRRWLTLCEYDDRPRMVRGEGGSGAILEQCARDSGRVEPSLRGLVLADQEFFPVFARFDLGAEPERHAAAARPDLIRVFRIAVLHRDGAGLGVSGPAPVSTATDFRKFGELRLQLLASLRNFRSNHRLDFGAQTLKLTRVHLFSNVIAISHRSYEERRALADSMPHTEARI